MAIVTITKLELELIQDTIRKLHLYCEELHNILRSDGIKTHPVQPLREVPDTPRPTRPCPIQPERTNHLVGYGVPPAPLRISNKIPGPPNKIPRPPSLKQA